VQNYLAKRKLGDMLEIMIVEEGVFVNRMRFTAMHSA
jgi:hypothetical protein